MRTAMTLLGSKVKVQYAPKLWLPNVGSGHGQLFTCARPGRSLGRNARVPDSVVCDWVARLPAAQKITIVSLLGLRENGESEFRYYTFRGGPEQSQRPKDPTFQDWLNTTFGTGIYTVVEQPTQDYATIPTETLEKIASTVQELLDSGGTVVLMDSGGDTRVTKVCKHVGFRKSTRNSANSLFDLPDRQPIPVAGLASEGKGDTRGGPS